MRLAELRRAEDGLAASKEAVAIRRRLVEVHPEALQPDLARALNNLGNHLGDIGRHDDAVAVIQEAVVICRAQAKARSDGLEPCLATSLTNLSVWLAEVDRPDAALAAIEERLSQSNEFSQDEPGEGSA